MSSREAIDKQVAELSQLLEGVDRSLEEQPKKKRRMPSWLTIVVVAAAIDIGARFFIPSSMPYVLKFEAAVFLTAAIALIAPLVRGKKLMGFRNKLHKWLAAAFVLGAIRSGMWGFGMPVEYANLTIFLMGLAGIVLVYFRRKKRGENLLDDP